MAKSATGTMFGWCMDGHHRVCEKEYRRWYVGTQRVKRKTVEAIVWTGETVHCTCTCHKGKKK